jgi:filamentous hemagglutinin family protein
MFKKFIAHLALTSLYFSQLLSSVALAQNLPIAADGTTNTQVTQTASGIDQVNIAAPNSSGLSHNKFTDYNVNASGQIINNFSGRVASEIAGGTGINAITQTQIGGLVNANSNLRNSGAARIILNEVTSTHNTQLNGYVEIAGTRAEIIIANPNGITCAGCGFINTSKMSLIAGQSEFDQNGALNFDLKEQVDFSIPLISISGLGLDVENVSAADIISSSIKLLWF